ncbi:hypothetical protein ACJX0J_014590 [Zea mays]
MSADEAKAYGLKNMGQKINPLDFRLGTTQNHHSFWFAQPKNYSEGLQEDKRIRNCINNYIRKRIGKKGSNRKMESDSSSETEGSLHRSDAACLILWDSRYTVLQYLLIKKSNGIIFCWRLVLGEFSESG